MTSTRDSPPDTARRLFAPIAASYERWASILSMGQDRRWRSVMVAGLALPSDSLVLDVAAGTGSITRLIAGAGHRVISLDQSPEMSRMAADRGATVVLAAGDRLPFGPGTFDAVTFGYLLRYVDDVADTVAELARVVRPGGSVGMVEFGRPRGPWGPLWWLYTRAVLPGVGAAIGHGWAEVGRFLGPSIDDFDARTPPSRLAAVWRESGLIDVRVRSMSLGGGLVVWGRRP